MTQELGHRIECTDPEFKLRGLQLLEGSGHQTLLFYLPLSISSPSRHINSVSYREVAMAAVDYFHP